MLVLKAPTPVPKSCVTPPVIDAPVMLGPNIIGQFAVRLTTNYASGAFSWVKPKAASGASAGNGSLIELDASRASPIYGKSNTVEVNSNQVLIIIKV